MSSSASGRHCLVTGGAGFIGRSVVAQLLRRGDHVVVVDDLSNGRRENLAELGSHLGLTFVHADINDEVRFGEVFAQQTWDVVFHLAASIHVQHSIDDPSPTFRNDTEGTLRVLEACRAQYLKLNGFDIAEKHFDHVAQAPRLSDRRPRVAVMSTCMVYDLAHGGAISESHPYRPASPYAAAKIGADMLALSYHLAYAMPVTVVRPFNTYGPFQKSNSEGGVVSIFLVRDLQDQPLFVKGSGEQTRDLLYVEDCADFVVRAAESTSVEGMIVNAGTGEDVKISELARMCCSENNSVELVAHDHPQAEIMKLCCDASRAKAILGWSPQTDLRAGLGRTRAWLMENRWAW